MELAAKAAGIEGQYFESENGIHIHTGIYRPGLDYYWNPLISDSEALRLAVKLNLTVRITDSAAIVFELCGKHDAVELLSRHGDLCSAARRAIVRAGAEIGRAMP
ncbi:hypothetical protein GHV66_07305 [Pseudomonas aeruginosa]|nr:hypothetical protein [Pseudomonas aeruginosa]MBG6828209.1 hypothetical protein [Pseudomonas aeruginosa]